MGRRKLLRLVGSAMLLTIVVFVACALSNPTLGTTVRIGALELGAAQWRAFYVAYAGVATGLFAASFFVDGKGGGRR